MRGSYALRRPAQESRVLCVGDPTAIEKAFRRPTGCQPVSVVVAVVASTANAARASHRAGRIDPHALRGRRLGPTGRAAPRVSRVLVVMAFSDFAFGGSGLPRRGA